MSCRCKRPTMQLLQVFVRCVARESGGANFCGYYQTCDAILNSDPFVQSHREDKGGYVLKLNWFTKFTLWYLTALRTTWYRNIIYHSGVYNSLPLSYGCSNVGFNVPSWYWCALVVFTCRANGTFSTTVAHGCRMKLPLRYTCTIIVLRICSSCTLLWQQYMINTRVVQSHQIENGPL